MAGDLPARHAFELVRDEQRRLGWYLSWRCSRRKCDARGNCTTGTRDNALKLFSLLSEAHAKVTEDGIKEEIDA